MKKECNKFGFKKIASSVILGACLLMPTSVFAGQALAQETQQLNRKPINILGNWRISIIEMDGAFIRVPEQAEGAMLQINNNQISGITGCNNFMTPYVQTLNPQRIVVSEGATTRKMCHPEEVMQFEDAFLRMFIGAFMVEKNFEGIALVRDNVKIYLVR